MSTVHQQLGLSIDPQDLQRALGWDREIATQDDQRNQMRIYIAYQMAAAGLAAPDDALSGDSMASFSKDIFASLREKNRILANHRAPIDARIETFLADYFATEVDDQPLTLPSSSLSLDRHGMARELSLPADGNCFENDLVSSYRCFNGVLNNPRADRRTTAGTFHVVAGGMPVPGDKRIVPKEVFVRLFRAAMNPPEAMMELPYTSQEESKTRTWVSLMLRPLVCPEVTGYCDAQSLETRFFVPGSLVSNLDFVESIFGNAGDPLSAANDAAIDVRHWSGHTGCVVLAPHLVSLTKKQLGLPHADDATDRQRRDSMCWSDPNERYNDGSAFKITCRDTAGVIVTLIADNYYGYCKKEVKTQISYAANLMGNVEEEHAGGALAFQSFSLGEEFQANSRRYNGRSFADVARDYSSFIDVQPEGYGIDRFDPTVIYIPEDARATLAESRIKWTKAGKPQHIPLSPKNVYIAPSGYKLRMAKHPAAPSWRLIGTVGEGIFCHKPCTVSGGGKSEISKGLDDYMLYGPIFVRDVDADFDKLDEIFGYSFENRWRDDMPDKPDYSNRPARSILDPTRSVGSVIQLLTPQPNFSDQYIAWLESIPEHVYALALIIKRFIKPEMVDDWRKYFGVDIVNGSPGHELKMDGRSLVGSYLRVGLDNKRWRTFKLRQDFVAAAKVQQEDDISCSVVVPASRVGNVGPALTPAGSYKFVANCEFRLFQRPDDAVHRGLDTQTELDLAQPDNFISNFEPLTVQQVREMVDDAVEFDKFTAPMQHMLSAAVQRDDGFVVSSSHPRLVNGEPSRNPRYLQDRPDMVKSRETYVTMRGMQLHRSLRADEPLHVPVGSVLSGRRNNPPDLKAGFRSLAVYSPLHYQELPELLMDYICSLTGKSPSTTGAGSEGALTKAPFNALHPAIDLNATVVSMILTGLGGFSTPAGHIGPRFEVGHDISLLIPEVWCRMGPEERDPQQLIDAGMLERVEDFVHGGKSIPAGRLGFRITKKFVRTYLGRVFDNPTRVFPDEILKPELQDLDSFADGVLHIAEAQRKVAQQYLEDGGYELACPPVRAVLSIMVHGDYEGRGIDDARVRTLFTRASLLQSDWYHRRLVAKRQTDLAHWTRLEQRLQEFAAEPGLSEVLEIDDRLAHVKQQLRLVRSSEYENSLVGTLGVDPMQLGTKDQAMLDRLAMV